MIALRRVTLHGTTVVTTGGRDTGAGQCWMWPGDRLLVVVGVKDDDVTAAVVRPCRHSLSWSTARTLQQLPYLTFAGS